MPFIDRTDAGRQLAKALARYKIKTAGRAGLATRRCAGCG